jgi:signal transduction histidine kinase
MSVLLYNFFIFSSAEIRTISLQSVINGSKIQTFNMKNSIEDKFQIITSNLKLLGDSPLTKQKNSTTISLMDTAQNTTNYLTEAYGWLNKNGSILWSSNFKGKTNYQRLLDSQAINVLLASNTKIKNYSSFAPSIILENRSNPRIFISYPILSNSSSSNSIDNLSNSNTHIADNGFRPDRNNVVLNGVIFASINNTRLTNIFNNLFQNASISNPFNLILDNNGTVIYSKNRQWQGKNIYNSEQVIRFIGDFYNGENKLAILNTIDNGLFHGNSDIKEIKTKSGKESILSYDNLILNNKPFLHILIEVPLSNIQKVQSLISSQNQFTFYFLFFIVLLAFSFIIIAYIINKKLKDIVDQKTKQLHQTIKSLEKANEDLKVNDKLQKDFINIAAHELRTPIQAVMGFTEIALEEENKKIKQNFDALHSSYYEYMTAINRNAYRLFNLIEKILDVAKIESNTMRLNKKSVDIHKEIENIVNEYGKNFKEKINSDKIEIKYQSSLPKHPILVEIDQLLIQQVMTNLLDNAIKATESNINDKDNKEEAQKKLSIIVSVSLSSLSDSLPNNFDMKSNDLITKTNSTQFILVKVSDEGKGIPKDFLSKLFTKFVSLSEKGTGLGLFIAKGVVEAHGGKIWAYNNKGATFAFTLPL